MTDKQSHTAKRRVGKTRLLIAAGALVGIGLIYALMPNGGEAVSTATTFVAKRGPLDIKVLTGGTSEAMESQEIRSEIEGREGTQILEIVEEGYVVSPEDVENGKVLVRLDAAQLEDRLVSQEKSYESARASYIEMQAAYDIQLNQNKSDITKAELDAKFAKMDLQKYLGQSTVTKLLADLGLDKRAEELANAEITVSAADIVAPPGMAIEEIRPELAKEPKAEMDRAGGGRPPWGDGPPPWMRNGDGAQPGGDGARQGRRRGGDGSGGGGERPEGGRSREGGRGGPGGGFQRPEGGGGPGGGFQRPEGGGPGGGGFGGGRGGWQGGPGGAEEGGIPLDDELIDAIAAAAAENGMPMEPEQFKQMLRARAGGDGVPTMPMRMAERMKSMGLDIVAIAERLGKSVDKPEEEPAAATLPATTMSVQLDAEYLEKRAAIDFSSYADVNSLEDGEAKQELRRMEDEALVAEENYQLALTDLEATERLVEREFETRTNLDRQRVTVQTNEIKKESAKVAKTLYIKYEFPKQTETLLSAYEEALANLERTRASAAAKLLQAEARLKSAEKDFLREGQQLEEAREQLSKCEIRAERSGMVVYGSSNDNNMYRGGSQEPIQEGTTVRERQLILTIPDMSHMAISVKIHESDIKYVTRGQKARIRVESHPNDVLMGEVVKVGVLPDSGDRWMNPDIKQYNVQISIQGRHEWLRPGMSAQVEILVDRLEDIVYIPIQSVNALGNERVCYVVDGGSYQRRVIETGAYNQSFIEVKSGLKEGETVLLRSPEAAVRGPENATGTGTETTEEKTGADAAA